MSRYAERSWDPASLESQQARQELRADLGTDQDHRAEAVRRSLRRALGRDPDDTCCERRRRRHEGPCEDWLCAL